MIDRLGKADMEYIRFSRLAELTLLPKIPLHALVMEIALSPTRPPLVGQIDLRMAWFQSP